MVAVRLKNRNTYLSGGSKAPHAQFKGRDGYLGRCYASSSKDGSGSPALDTLVTNPTILEVMVHKILNHSDFNVTGPEVVRRIV